MEWVFILIMLIIAQVYECDKFAQNYTHTQDQPGQFGETLSLLKIEKLAGHGGLCL